jgi:Ca-activated chloride channel family protein
LEGFDPSAMTAPPGGAPQPGGPDAQPVPAPEAMKKQIEGLKQSMQKAVELGPRIHDLTDEAATHLQEKEPAQALPKQEEALKLLKEIADPLPRQDQQQQGDQQQDQQQGDQQQQEQSGQEQKQQEREPQDLSKRQAESVLRKARERQRQRRDLQKQLDRQIYRPGAVEKDW